MTFFCHRQKNVGAKFTLLRRGAAGGSRTRTPIRTQAPQACQSTSSSTAADHSNSTSCLIIILRLALFVNSIFSPARKKTAKKVLTPGTSYGSIFLALNGAKPLARVVELVDSLASGASVRKDVRVRLPPRAPNQYNPNLFPIGDGFGLFVFFDRYETTYFRNGVKRKPTSKPREPRKKKKSI